MALSPVLVLFVLCAAFTQQGAGQNAVPRKLLRPLPSPYSSLLERYMSNEELAAWLKSYVQRCGHISQLTSFGRSTSGAELYALEISNTPGQATQKPEIKYVGNVHGDEPSGRQLLPALAEKLCAEYPSNPQVAQVVERLHLHLIPTMNPDGFTKKRRENAASVDLNRNFPDPLRKASDRASRIGMRNAIPQPETAALMDYTLRHRFMASLAIHEGALVANYPMDGYPDGSLSSKRVKQPAADDAAFMYMARLYAQGHKTMARSREFAGGITNGAQWYPLYGGMQDWNYLVAGCMELTLELCDNKWPKPNQLAQIWDDNEQVLLEWPLAIGLGGLHGSVYGIGRGNRLRPLPATIAVEGIQHNITASPAGVFHRVLAPGNYTVLIMAHGYKTQALPVTIPNPVPGSGHMGAHINVTLTRLFPLEAGWPAAGAASAGDAYASPISSPGITPQPVKESSSSSSVLASNQKVLVLVVIQVLVIGAFIAFRRRRLSSSHSIASKA